MRAEQQLPALPAAAELGDHGVRQPGLAALGVDADEQHPGAGRAALIGRARHRDQLAHRGVAVRRLDMTDPDRAQLGDRGDVVAPRRPGALGEVAQLAAGLVIFAEGDERLDDLEPGGEVAVVLDRQAGLERAQYLAGRVDGVAIEPEVCGRRGHWRGRGRRPARDSFGPRRGCGRARREGRSAPRDSRRSTNRASASASGRVDILVGRAVAREAGGEPVAIILDADAGDDDVLALALGGWRRLDRGGGRGGKQNEGNAHLSLPG